MLNKKVFLPFILLIVVLLAGILLPNIPFAGNRAWSLRVADPRDRVVYYDLEVKAGDIFSFSLRNSVSKSVVSGTFLITEEGLIKPLTTAFTSYGPGLPFDFLEDYLIEDGVITVFHHDPPRDKIRLWVTPQTEETIYLHDQVYPLSTLSESSILLEIWVALPGLN